MSRKKRKNNKKETEMGRVVSSFFLIISCRPAFYDENTEKACLNQLTMFNAFANTTSMISRESHPFIEILKGILPRNDLISFD